MMNWKIHNCSFRVVCAPKLSPIVTTCQPADTLALVAPLRGLLNGFIGSECTRNKPISSEFVLTASDTSRRTNHLRLSGKHRHHRDVLKHWLSIGLVLCMSHPAATDGFLQSNTWLPVMSSCLPFRMDRPRFVPVCLSKSFFFAMEFHGS